MRKKLYSSNILDDLEIIEACVRVYPILLGDKLSKFKRECLDLIVKEELDAKDN